MPGLVTELVNAAIDVSVPAGDLLRKALVAARRLDVPELVGWINGELYGYKTGEIPEYRVLQGQLKAMNPRNGPIPLTMPTAESAAHLSIARIHQPLSELVQLAQSETGVFCYFPPEIEYRLMQGMSTPLRPALSVATTQIQAIVDYVRTKILDWALDMESRGILGEGMTFTPEEKKMVQEQHYHFENVSGSQIQISSNGSSQSQQQTGDTAALVALIEALGNALNQPAVAADLKDELLAELATLQAQLGSPKPKWQIIKATAGSIKAVLENVAGSVIATQVLPFVAPLLASS